MTRILEQLEAEEGFVPHVYQDGLSFWTIGIGRLIDKRRGGGITHDEALYLLGNDVARITHDLLRRFRWFDGLDAARQAVLVGMAFQMGVQGLLGFQRTLLKIEAPTKMASVLALPGARQMYSAPATLRWATQGGVMVKTMVSPLTQATPPALTVKATLAWLKGVSTVPEPMLPVTLPATLKVVAPVRVTVMVSCTDEAVPIRPVIRPLPVPV